MKTASSKAMNLRPAASRLRTTAVRMALFLALAGALAVALPGCGGGGHSSKAAAGRKRGQATLTIRWPQRSRVIPDGANSIVVHLTPQFTPAGAAPAPVTVNRPAPGEPNEVKLSFPDLELGDYLATAAAYAETGGPTGNPQPDGINNPQARGASTPITIRDGETAAVTLVMDNRVKTLRLFRENSLALRLLPTPQTVQITATAYDDTPDTATPPGPYVVLTGPSNIRYTSSNAAVATVGSPEIAGTTPGLVTPVGVGVAVITATYSEPTDPGTAPVVAATTVVVSPLGPLVSAWGRFHADAQNTGQATQGAAASGSGLVAGWPLQTNSAVTFSSPALAADGTVYVGTTTNDLSPGADDNTLFAIKSDGSLKWKLVADGGIDASPAIDANGTVFFGSRGGTIYALRDIGSSAEILWSRKLSGPVIGSATIDKNGYVYVGTGANADDTGPAVYALDSLTGAIRWSSTNLSSKAESVSGELGIESTPALAPDEATVYFSGVDGFVYAFATGNQIGTVGGQRRWASKTSNTIVASPTVNPTTGDVYVGSLDGKMYAFDGNGGGVKWSYDAAGVPIFTTAALSGAGVLYFGTFDSTSGLDASRLYALDASTGVPAAAPSAPFPAGFTSSPAISADGTLLYVGCYDGNVYGIETGTSGAAFGAIAWNFDVPPPPAGPLVTTFDSSPAVGPDGVVYIGGFDGNVYAIQ